MNGFNIVCEGVVYHKSPYHENFIMLCFDGRELHVSGGCVHVQEEAGLLPVPHLRPHLSNRDHVLDQLLDQAGGCARPGHAGGHLPPHPLHPACQQSEVSAPCVIHQGI